LKVKATQRFQILLRSYIDAVNQPNLPLKETASKRKAMARLLVVVTLFIASLALAQDTESTEAQRSAKQADFEISPNQCVTLRQGQPCFVRIRFNWVAPEPLQACLRNIDGENLACWQTAMQGAIVLPQTLPNSTEYSIVDADGLVISSATVSVSWVYRKKRSKRRWRLF